MVAAAAAATANASAGTGASTTTTTTTAAQGNTKEKCRKFLANLIELSTREPKPVEKNVRTLIQELVNANVEPEEFCDRLERLLNASPQPCLIGFLKVRSIDSFSFTLISNIKLNPTEKFTTAASSALHEGVGHRGH